MLLFVAATMLGFAVFLVAEIATVPQRRHRVALRRASHYGKARTQVVPELPRFRERVLAPLVKRLAALALRINPRISGEAIGTRLIAAGVATRITVAQFLALKAGLALAGLVAAVAAGFALGAGVGLLLAAVGVAGFLIPDLLIGARVRARRERVRAELPDALDLLAVSIEAGLGLDGAITKLTEHMDGALVDEFALTLGEMRIGESRPDALRKLAERVPAPELGAFVRSVLQADQLGISLGRVLRVQAADSRLRRQAAAEEKAMKAPIKMLFPTALLIFPALFVVVLGPALLNVTHYLR
ncbi:MAG TPA: type II secretion system F family protein [Gaiellaceae bacterium]|nr:type II secretion system F family protein [Gaiellaceae bacterium]HUJ56656.1 type II secretion system F family protein [Gaiellaceae bacterium]